MRTQYSFKNLDCANCALKIEEHLRNIAGFKDATVNFSTLTLHIDSNDIDLIRKEITKIEPTVQITPSNGNAPIGISPGSILLTHRKQLALIAISTILLIILLSFEKQIANSKFGYSEYIIALTAFLLCGWSVLLNAARTIYRKQWFDENVLMSIASVGALIIHAHEEAIGVMIFYQIGEFLQNLAVNRSRTSIQKLLEIRPDYANLRTSSGVKKVSPQEVNVGDTIVVKAGEKIPLDAIIIEGRSQINTAVLTGESVPKSVGESDTVLAGEINLTGILTLRVQKIFSESSVSKILDLVENASEKKTKTENFVTTFARYYTPIVVGLSILLAVLPPLFIADQTFTTWVYRALVLLVISCPCALIISIPLGYFGGIGGASRRGILIKGSNFIDALANIRSVVFDKTGTLTKGDFKVIKVVTASGHSEQDILSFAAFAEAHSNHPIARSIVKAFTDKYGVIDESVISEHQEISGHGVTALVNGHTVVGGNDTLMKREGIHHPDYSCNETIVYVAIDKTFAGYITIGDEIKEDALRAINHLHKMGITDITMLTGDNKKTAAIIGEQLSIKNIFAELLPEHKVEQFEILSEKKHHNGTIAFVGDGINDSPVIARADVGIAMGALGSDAAIETADIVLMTDHPSKVAVAIGIGRKTRSIVIQNIIMALGIKLVFVVLGCIGLASMWEAVFADMGVAIIAVLNASRALNYKELT